MANEDYVVGARLELHAPTVLRSLKTVSDRMTALGAKISGTNSMFRNMLGSAVAFGGAYVGVRAVSSAVAGIAREGFAANAQLETMRLSLASVYGAVEGKTLEQSLQGVQGVFDDLTLAAAQSPAEFTDLVGIMNQIYGPLRVAGMEMDDMVNLTNNASAASMALGISNDVVGSSMARMVRGAAGMENPLFSMLTSMGLITEKTEEWNRLAAPERAKKLADAINKIGGESAEAFGRTWSGVSATLSDLLGIFKGTFMRGSFTAIRDTLLEASDYLMTYRENIERVMTLLGERMGSAVQRAFNVALRGYNLVLNNLDAITARMDAMVARFLEIRPILAEAAKLFLALQVGRGVLGPLLSAMGSVGGAMAWIGGLMGGGGAAAGAAGAGAAAAGGAAAGGGVLASTMTAIGTAASVILPPLLALAAVVAAVWVGFQEFGSYLTPAIDAFGSAMEGTGSDLMAIISMVWDFIGPPISMLGGIIGGTVIAVFRVLGGVVRVVLAVLKAFGNVVSAVGRFLAPVFHMLGEMILTLMEHIGRLGDAIARFARGFTGDSSGGGGSGPASGFLDTLRAAWAGSPESGSGGSASGDAPRDRAGTVVNMQGSRITVNQEFREADPDRVWIAMRDALEREAVQRTQSGFANALTR